MYRISPAILGVMSFELFKTYFTHRFTCHGIQEYFKDRFGELLCGVGFDEQAIMVVRDDFW
jgi:hypothetical protein